MLTSLDDAIKKMMKSCKPVAAELRESPEKEYVLVSCLLKRIVFPGKGGTTVSVFLPENTNVYNGTRDKSYVMKRDEFTTVVSKLPRPTSVFDERIDDLGPDLDDNNAILITRDELNAAFSCTKKDARHGAFRVVMVERKNGNYRVAGTDGKALYMSHGGASIGTDEKILLSYSVAEAAIKLNMEDPLSVSTYDNMVVVSGLSRIGKNSLKQKVSVSAPVSEIGYPDIDSIAEKVDDGPTHELSTFEWSQYCLMLKEVDSDHYWAIKAVLGFYASEGGNDLMVDMGICFDHTSKARFAMFKTEDGRSLDIGKEDAVAKEEAYRDNTVRAYFNPKLLSKSTCVSEKTHPSGQKGTVGKTWLTSMGSGSSPLKISGWQGTFIIMPIAGVYLKGR